SGLDGEILDSRPKAWIGALRRAETRSGHPHQSHQEQFVRCMEKLNLQRTNYRRMYGSSH
ncbi:MAG: hypothetical protein KGI83_05430, partial [Verrucomicrobiota bacterium]|nr:hypothetical protein [Verrucomicrobiota bacterium]